MHSNFYTLHYPFLSARSDLEAVFLRSKKFAQQKIHPCLRDSAEGYHTQSYDCIVGNCRSFNDIPLSAPMWHSSRLCASVLLSTTISFRHVLVAVRNWARWVYLEFEKFAHEFLYPAIAGSTVPVDVSVQPIERVIVGPDVHRHVLDLF